MSPGDKITDTHLNTQLQYIILNNTNNTSLNMDNNFFSYIQFFYLLIGIFLAYNISKIILHNRALTARLRVLNSNREYTTRIHENRNVPPSILSTQVRIVKINEFILETDINSMCSICLEPFVENNLINTLKCKHMYHSKCIDTWFSTNNNNCPMCRCII